MYLGIHSTFHDKMLCINVATLLLATTVVLKSKMHAWYT